MDRALFTLLLLAIAASQASAYCDTYDSDCYEEDDDSGGGLAAWIIILIVFLVVAKIGFWSCWFYFRFRRARRLVVIRRAATTTVVVPSAVVQASNTAGAGAPPTYAYNQGPVNAPPPSYDVAQRTAGNEASAPPGMASAAGMKV